MDTILIAHRDEFFASRLATELRGRGYRVIACPGPLPPEARCIRCDKGYCPLSEGTDLMIYDPQISAVDPAGQSHNLALDSALAHPDVPMLLAWSSDTAPDAGTLRAIRAAAPWVHLAAQESDAFQRQVRALIDGASIPVG